MNDGIDVVIIIDPDTTPEHLGLLPGFINSDDPRSAREQFDANYGFAGGWRPMQGFKMGQAAELLYPGDPPLSPIAMMRLRDELILFYESAWVLVLQKNGDFEVCRMD